MVEGDIHYGNLEVVGSTHVTNKKRRGVRRGVDLMNIRCVNMLRDLS